MHGNGICDTSLAAILHLKLHRLARFFLKHWISAVNKCYRRNACTDVSSIHIELVQLPQCVVFDGLLSVSHVWFYSLFFKALNFLFLIVLYTWSVYWCFIHIELVQLPQCGVFYGLLSVSHVWFYGSLFFKL